MVGGSHLSYAPLVLVADHVLEEDPFRPELRRRDAVQPVLLLHRLDALRRVRTERVLR